MRRSSSSVVLREVQLDMTRLYGHDHQIAHARLIIGLRFCRGGIRRRGLRDGGGWRAEY
jgi:hypothetical protein